MFTNPTIANFKAFFTRDFPYGSDPALNVLDSDITRAINEADIVINEGLFCDQAEYTLAFEYLAAHNLAMNLRESSQGLASQFEWGVSSKSVGSVSVGLNLPTDIASNPQYAYYAKTSYGVKYLMMILPKLVGRIFAVGGRTHA